MTDVSHITARSPYGCGDEWLGRNPSILIQAKNASDTSFHGRSVFARSVAVGGPLLILSRMPSEFEVSGLLVVRIHANTSLGKNRAQRSPELDFQPPSDVEFLPTLSSHDFFAALSDIFPDAFAAAFANMLSLRTHRP